MSDLFRTLAGRPAAVAYLLLYVLTVAGHLTGVPTLLDAAILCGLPFLGLILGRSLLRNRITGAVLIAIGLLSAAAAEKPALAVLIEGGRATLPFLVLFGAALSLHHPAQRSPAMQQIARYIDAQPPGRRFPAVAGAAQGLGAVLNQAALILVYRFARGGDPRSAVADDAVMIVRGFLGAVFWSPMFVALSVVLSAVPGTSWFEILPYGFPAALIVTLCGYIAHRTARPPAIGNARAAVASPSLLPALKRLAGVFGTLGIGIVAAVEGLGIPIPIAIGLIAPPVAVAWLVLGTDRAGRHTAQAEYSQELWRIPGGLGNETLLFLGANVAAVGISAWLGQVSAETWQALLPDSISLRAIGLVGLGIVVSGLGLHPVVYLLVAGQSLPPDILGLTPAFMGVLLLTVWSLGVAVSPLAATVLQMAKLSGVSPFYLAWRRNGPFVAGTFAVLSAVCILYLEFG